MSTLGTLGTLGTSINDLPTEMLLSVANFCDIRSIRIFNVCNVHFEKTFTENQRYSNLLFLRLGRSLVKQALDNFYGINDPVEEDPVAIYLNHLN